MKDENLKSSRPIMYCPTATFAIHPPLQTWEHDFIHLRETEDEKLQANTYIKEKYGREYSEFLNDDNVGFDKIQILSADRMLFIKKLREGCK